MYASITHHRAWLGTWAIATATIVLAGGCARGPYPLGPGFPAGDPWAANSPTAMGATSAQSQVAELQRRVELLDKDNRQLQTQLAQSEQQSQVYRDELGLMRAQLADTVQRLEASRLAAQRTEQQFQGLQASTRFRGGASLEANTNVRQIAEALKASGFSVAYQGDAAHVLLPADQLFQPGTAQPLPQAARMLTPLASQITRLAPNQRLSVEAHWDDSQVPAGNYASAQQLTSAQAAAVAELLVQQGGLPGAGITPVGAGATRPRESNQTAVGRAANRRVEVVILPATL